jgi:hypothetical protein
MLLHDFVACKSLTASVAVMAIVTTVPVIQGVHVLFGCVNRADAALACLTGVTHVDVDVLEMTKAIKRCISRERWS